LVTDYKKWKYLILPFISGKVRIADSNFFSYSEGIVWMKKYFFTHNHFERDTFKSLSLKNYKELLLKKSKSNNAYCFLTGPSFSDYKNFSYEKDSVKIICNSIVKDAEFLEYINGPDIITFADCVFHFGPSKYAHTFREMVYEVVKKYDSYVIIPEMTIPLLLNYYPGLKNRVIGLGLTKSFNFPTIKNPNIYGTNSIATYFMLPIASSLSVNVFFIGADGRQPNENYWWKHNSNVQFTDLMKTVFETHPSFFRDRIYSSDYKKHCKTFKQLVEYGESRNIHYHSLTKSFIPVLSMRGIDYLSLYRKS
jgi:hypothetical protein